MIEIRTIPSGELHVPQVDAVSRPFFAALARGEFVLQWIPRSGFQHYPRPAALYAPDNQPEWRSAQGVGVVHTFTIIRQHGIPYFRDRTPYVVAVIELPEGVRIMGNLTDVEVDTVRIGMAVQIYAVVVAEDLAVPFWKPQIRSLGPL